MNHEEAQPKSRPAVSSKARLPTGITRRAGKGGNAYQVRVRMTGLPTLTKTFGKLEDARAWKSKVESSLNAGEPVITAKAGRYTIHEALTDYSKYADGVTDKKRYTLQQLNDELGEFAVANLTSEVLAKWLDKKKEETVPAPKSKRTEDAHHPLYAGAVSRKYSDSTVRKYYYTLKVALEWHARFKKYPFHNPFNSIKAPVEDNGRQRRLKKGEERRLLDACDEMYKNRDELKRIILFAIETAMRAGEILSLEWHEVDFKTRSISIPKEKCKTKRARVVPITQPCMKILKEHMKATKTEEQSRVFWQWKNSDLLGHRFKVITKNAGLENFRFHDLRHEAASRLFEKSRLTEVEIAYITGHSDLRTLMRYTHLRPNSLLAKMW